MKKLLIILIVLSVFDLRGSCINNQQKEVSIKQRMSNMISAVNNGLDYMLTAKGAIKTTIILAPFLTLYCHYFDIDPVQGIINKIIQRVGNAQETYKIQREIGRSMAFWETIAKQPLGHLYIETQKLLDKAVHIGLPVFLGILIKKRFNL